jgi:cyclic beta-1,2-glucan synthetase
MAFARLQSGDEAARLLQIMNPIEQTRTAVDVDRYKGEPYVVAADVSAAPNRNGRSGWTWYTGSAAWMYRIWLEEVLGITVRKNRLSVRPVLPAGWEGFSFTYRHGSATYEVEVVLAEGSAAGDVELVDDGRIHRVRLAVRDIG